MKASWQSHPIWLKPTVASKSKFLLYTKERYRYKYPKYEIWNNTTLIHEKKQWIKKPSHPPFASPSPQIWTFSGRKSEKEVESPAQGNLPEGEKLGGSKTCPRGNPATLKSKLAFEWKWAEIRWMENWAEKWTETEFTVLAICKSKLLFRREI